ncbi:hypothetical protein GCM10020218_013580 [Dactylosporangium vinaceum]
MTATTSARTAAAIHNRVCIQPVTGQIWSDRCHCRHVRGRHTAAIHAAITTPLGVCTGRNLAGACLWPFCPCSGFTGRTEIRP